MNEYQENTNSTRITDLQFKMDVYFKVIYYLN